MIGDGTASKGGWSEARGGRHGARRSARARYRAGARRRSAALWSEYCETAGVGCAACVETKAESGKGGAAHCGPATVWLAPRPRLRCAAGRDEGDQAGNFALAMLGSGRSALSSGVARSHASEGFSVALSFLSATPLCRVAILSMVAAEGCGAALPHVANLFAPQTQRGAARDGN